MSLLALSPDTVFDETPPNIPDEPPTVPGADGTPKRRGRPPKDPNAPATPRKPRNTWPEAEATERHLTALIEGASVLVRFADPFDADVLAEGGPQIVHELVELARTDKVLRKYLELSATPGKYGPLTISIIGVALPILVHHRIIPFPLPKTANTPEG